MPAQFQLVMRSGPNAGKVYPLELAEIIIGRDTTNTIVINDAEISRRHAKLIVHGSSYVIQDLGSTNGTFVNDIRVTSPLVLNPGDNISLGENISVSYEAAYDANATVISSAKVPPTAVPPQRAAIPIPPPVSVATPAPVPTPTPALVPVAAPSPAPAPVYSGQVSAGPASLPEVPAKRGGGKIILIIVIVLVLILCLCVGIPFIVDALKMDCKVPFKWFFNIVGPLFGYAPCP